ncbi:hypothetical protein [Amnibacterium endophyticum]|uniref:Glycosyltransferase RgtA/B/C/D-like domain-containing protein n=1 Tax=Amnibacterium endophyticum TaxID=2109337 RepID=A0ABW4LFQ6_9MICO
MTVDRAATADLRAVMPRPTLRAGSLVLHCLALFAAARTVTSVFLLWLTTQTTAASEAGASPSFTGLSSVWDGRWYRRIAYGGYPATLPVDAHGQVLQNEWAFLPGYPFVTRVVSTITGADWSAAAVGTALVLGAAAAVLLGLLLAPHVGADRALLAVALFSFSPVAFMLQTAYADSMMLCLVFGALLLVDRGRSGWAIPVVIAASLTRPGVLAVALAVALVLLQRWREERRWTRRTTWDLALLAVAGVGGLAWPLIAGSATGRADAYVLTEIAWRAPWTGSAVFTPFEPWLFVAQQLFGIAGPPVLGLVVGATAWFVLIPARRLGRTARIWVGAYALYLLAVFMPQTSLPRLLMPMAPALGAIRTPSRTVAIALVALSTVLQLLWCWCTYGPVKTWLTVP